MSPLRVDTLAASVGSVTIGQLHKDILQDKLLEFTKFLQQRKCELEHEYSAFAESNGIAKSSKFTGGSMASAASGPPDMGQELRGHQQQELDTLRTLFQDRLDHLFQKFQKEWQQDPREKTASFPLPKTGIESAYLGEQLGDALGRGLAEICEQRPKDPIEYLALWLRQYSHNMKRKQEAAIHALKMKLEGETGDMIREEQGVLARERIHIKQEEERRRKIFLEQAKQVDKAKEEAVSEETLGGDVDNKQETDKDGHTGGSTKRVTVVEPENPKSLYTIEEKDSVNGTGDDDDDDDDDDGKD